MFPLTTANVIERIAGEIHHAGYRPTYNALLFPTGAATTMLVPVPGGRNAYMPWLNPNPVPSNISHEIVTMAVTVVSGDTSRERTLTVVYLDQVRCDHPSNESVAAMEFSVALRLTGMPAIQFYHRWEGASDNPINTEDGTAAEPLDVDLWEHFRIQEEKKTAEELARKEARFHCSICLDTFFQPVLYCYKCLKRWLRTGKIECPYCGATLKDSPIRDNIFEMELADAISGGHVVKSPDQLGKNVAPGAAEYQWDGILFRMSIARLVKLTNRSAYSGHLAELFSRLDVVRLYKLVLCEGMSARSVLRYCGDLVSPCVRLSDLGKLDLPAELLIRIIGFMDYKTRTVFTRACRALYDLSAAIAQHDLTVVFCGHGLKFHEVRLMLLATHTVVGGLGIARVLRTTKGSTTKPLEFYTTRAECDDVRAFLSIVGGFRVKRAVHGDKYTIFHMRKGALRIKIIRCPRSAVSGALMHQSTASQGICDGNSIRHPYPVLLSKGQSLTTPILLPIDDELESHVAAWKLLRDCSCQGLDWVSDFDEGHICGRAYSCPSTFRHSSDAGWSVLRLPRGDLGAAFRPDNVCWSLGGTGCVNGTLQSGEPCPIPIHEDENWFILVDALIRLDEAPTTVEDYNN
ncbi:hypothetical protein B0H15DRAFT_951668 [Mycena belliarum]|uniref:F-box domain-containing protein n=1 Tax=Mycena belliarum TaxID=1033014 RepID=A0AAD6U4E7_9AGAR|nr:hypothetical protein B0H15DRAFT_951668 [Mycena belliae]